MSALLYRASQQSKGWLGRKLGYWSVLNDDNKIGRFLGSRIGPNLVLIRHWNYAVKGTTLYSAVAKQNRLQLIRIYKSGTFSVRSSGIATCCLTHSRIAYKQLNVWGPISARYLSPISPIIVVF